MFKLLYKFINLIVQAQSKFYHLKYESNSGVVFANSTTKTSMNCACTLKIQGETEANKQKVERCSKELVKRNIKTPEKLLDFVKNDGTPVYKSPHADTLLWLIGEEEGFITPLRGAKALFLNLALAIFANKKFTFSFSTEGLFFLRDLPLDIYIMSHEFYKWYGYKMKLPGYDYSTQEKFKRVYKTLSDTEISKFSLADVLSVKEAIARNVESINFVINIAKEYEGSKKSLNKIMAKGGARI